MFQQRIPLPATPFAERLRNGITRRGLGLGLALLIEALLILLVLTLGRVTLPEVEVRRPAMTTINVREATEEASQPQRAESQQPTQARPEPRQQPDRPQPPQPPQPATPAPVAPATPTPPVPQGIIPMRWSLAPPNPLRPPAQPATPTTPAYGPADNRSVMFRDTPRVGTAPNGQPMYAAEWYREPSHAMMASYLSGARGPGWGLIACRTASEYRVEDCVGLGEYPEGSNIMRSALAAAWEFRVRPPRRGGQVLVGSWVRIRIDYH